MLVLNNNYLKNLPESLIGYNVVNSFTKARNQFVDGEFAPLLVLASAKTGVHEVATLSPEKDYKLQGIALANINGKLGFNIDVTDPLYWNAINFRAKEIRKQAVIMYTSNVGGIRTERRDMFIPVSNPGLEHVMQGLQFPSDLFIEKKE